jgi:hypothetical protein
MTVTEAHIPSAGGGVETGSDPQRVKAELNRLDATIHTLNARFAQERMRVARAHADIEAFTFWLQDAERRVAHLERASPTAWIRRLRDLLKRRSSALRRGPDAPRPDFRRVPSARFRYFIRNSPFRVYREPTFTLEGWAFPENGTAVTGLRARVDSEVFFGTYGVDEPLVPEWHGVQPNNPLPGFKIIIDTPVGRHRLSLEAQLDGDLRWYCFLALPIYSVGDGFKAQ